jgi:hypothetical protein
LSPPQVEKFGELFWGGGRKKLKKIASKNLDGASRLVIVGAAADSRVTLSSHSDLLPVPLLPLLICHHSTVHFLKKQVFMLAVLFKSCNT